MSYVSEYRTVEPPRAEIDSLSGVTLLEFGASWCPICQGAQPSIEAVMKSYPHVRHIKIEDGSGRPLGRSFRIKLWPTLVAIQDGEEIARVVRPTGEGDISNVLSQLR